MKPLLFASLLVLSSASVALAQCSWNGWCKAGCGKDGFCEYVKVLSRDGPIVIFLNANSDGEYKFAGDCQQYKTRFLEIEGVTFTSDWEQMMPGTMGERAIQTACESDKK